MEAEERSEESQRDLAQKWQDAIRVKPESQRRWDVIKVVLRSLSLVCAVALILSFVALYKNHGFVFPVDVWTASLGSLVPGAAIISWALAEFITICVRRRKSGLRLTGIPPGAHVAADLLIWITTIVFVGVIAAALIGFVQAPYSSVRNQDIIISVAILAFDTALTGLHFTLFVRACMETERRNSEKQIRKAIVSLRQRGLHLAGFNLPGIVERPASTIEDRGQGSYELSPLAPDAPRHDALRRDSEPVERHGDLPAAPGRALARPEAGADADATATAQMEENMKFIIPPSIIREMTDQKYSMMGPANGEQKYPGIRRGER